MKKRCVQIIILSGILALIIYGSVRNRGDVETAVEEEEIPSDAELFEIPEIYGGGALTRTRIMELSADESIGSYANTATPDICYAKGYFYYPSQLDHYCLYRMREDGSESEKLQNLHATQLLASGDRIYFINIADHHSLYRMKTDGTDCEKVTGGEDGEIADYTIAAGYIYYRVAGDDVPGEGSGVKDSREDTYNCLYRMREDGSGKELLISGHCRQYTVHEEMLYYVGDGGMLRARNLLSEEDDILPGGINDIMQLSYYRGCLYYTRLVKITGKACLCCYALESGMETRILDLNWSAVTKYCFYGDSVWQLGDNANPGSGRDIVFATEKGIFQRRFVSGEKGVRWFRLRGDQLEEAEDESAVEVMPNAARIYTREEQISVVFRKAFGTERYWDYIAEELYYYEAYCTDDEIGDDHGPYEVRLPQFNEKLAGYQNMNRYLRGLYQAGVDRKQAFMEVYEKEIYGESYPERNEQLFYPNISITENYVTVFIAWGGYYGGIRNTWEMLPVTFLKSTGEVVTLEDLFHRSEPEIYSMLTAYVYKFKECDEEDRLQFSGENEILRSYGGVFCMTEEGLAIYYPVYAIAPGAAGDFLFVIPYEELGIIS